MRLRIAVCLVAVAAALGLAATVIGPAGAVTTHAAAVSGAALGTGAHSSSSSTTSGLPPIRHVFIIVLENESASVTFPASGAAPAPYLADTMVADGAFLPNYYGTGHNSNDNYISMISGQAPNTQNSDDCILFDNFPSDATTGAPYDQQEGTGCIYPADIQNIATQLDSAGLSWKSYDEDMGADPSREAGECGHPAVGSVDGTQSEVDGDAYATRHDPFVYFHSIIDDTTLCDTHVVNLGQLQSDLQSAATTPNYVFITPNLCQDGHDATCKTPGENGGFAGINDFLSKYVPMITNSPAFKDENGLLITTFDEAATSDASSCCGEIPGPGAAEPGLTGSGGGQVGAVLQSPCIAPGTVSDTAYDHYSMLGSVENIFGLSHLGYAALPGQSYFGSDIFTGKCDSGPSVTLRAGALKLASAGTKAQLPLSFSSATAGTTYTLQVRQISGAAATAWKTLYDQDPRPSRVFSGVSGRTYEFRLQGTNALGITGAYATATVIVPTTAKPAGARLGGHWTYLSDAGALRSRAEVGRVGATLTYTYTGAKLQIVATRLPAGGRVLVSFDNRSTVVDVHAATHTPQSVIFSGGTQGHHTLKLTVLSGHLAVEGLVITNLG